MTKVDYVERLEKLGEVVKAVPPKRFNMSLWIDGDDKSCGTVGCAAGHACSDPWFRRRGLTLDECELPVYRGNDPFPSLQAFFDLSGDDVGPLFSPMFYYQTSGAWAKRKFLTRLTKIINTKRAA